MYNIVANVLSTLDRRLVLRIENPNLCQVLMSRKKSEFLPNCRLDRGSSWKPLT